MTLDQPPGPDGAGGILSPGHVAPSTLADGAHFGFVPASPEDAANALLKQLKHDSALIDTHKKQLAGILASAEFPFWARIQMSTLFAVLLQKVRSALGAAWASACKVRPAAGSELAAERRRARLDDHLLRDIGQSRLQARAAGLEMVWRP